MQNFEQLLIGVRNWKYFRSIWGGGVLVERAVSESESLLQLTWMVQEQDWIQSQLRRSLPSHRLVPQ